MAGTSRQRLQRERELLAQILVAARKVQGLSQRRLAQRLKWARSTVANVETGEREVKVIELPLWARALRTTAAELIAQFEAILETEKTAARRKRKRQEHARRRERQQQGPGKKDVET